MAKDDSILSSFQRIGEDARRQTQKLSELERLREEAQERASETAWVLNNTPGLTSSQRLEYSKELIKATNQADAYNRQINRIEATRFDAATQGIKTATRRAFSSSSINGEVARLQKKSTVSEAIRVAYHSPNGDQVSLDKQEQDLIAKLGHLERGAERAGDLELSGDVDKINRGRQIIKQIGTRKTQLEEELAVVRGAQAMHRKMGTDTQSRQLNVLEAGEKAAAYVARSDAMQNAARDAASSKIKTDDKSFEQEAQKYTKIMRELAETSEKLKTATDDAAKALTEKSEQLIKERDKSEIVQSAMQKEKERKEERSQKIYNRAMMFGSFMDAVSGMATEHFVNRPIAQAQAVQGKADWENQKYYTYEAASAGDIKSQIMLANKYFEQSEEFGKKIRKGQIAANALTATAAGAQGAASGFGLASSVFASFSTSQATGTAGLAVSSAQQHAINLMQSMSSLAREGTKAFSDNPAPDVAQAELQARHAFMQQLLAKGEVGFKQIQGLRDFTVGAHDVAMTMGGQAGENFMNELVNPENIKAMERARISPTEMIKLSAFGAGNMGAAFNKDQIYLAKQLEKANLGTAQMQMQRMSAFASAGSNNPAESLKAVLEAAFSKSLESSKVLNEMVSYTSKMAQSDQMMHLGLDTAGQYAQRIVAGVQPNSKNAAEIARSASMAEKLKELGGSVDVNMVDMASTASISTKFNLSSVAATILNKAGPERLASLKSDKDIQAFLDESGLLTEVNQKIKSGNIENYQELINYVIDIGKGKQLSNRGKVQAIGGNINRFQELTKKEAAGTLTDQEKIQLQAEKDFIKKGFALDDMSGRIAMDQVNSKKTIGSERLRDAVEGKSGINSENVFDFKTQGGAQQSAALIAASKSFKDAGDVIVFLKNLADVSEKMRKEGQEEKSRDAAKNASGDPNDFKDMSEEFKKSILDPMALLIGPKSSYIEALNNHSASLKNANKQMIPQFPAPPLDKKISTHIK
jgi:hypothetical protein